MTSVESTRNRKITSCVQNSWSVRRENEHAFYITNYISACSSTGSIHNELGASEGFPVVCVDSTSAEHHECKTSEYGWFEKVRSWLIHSSHSKRPDFESNLMAFSCHRLGSVFGFRVGWGEMSPACSRGARATRPLCWLKGTVSLSHLYHSTGMSHSLTEHTHMNVQLKSSRKNVPWIGCK